MKMQYLFILIGTILLSACGNKTQTEHSLEAQQTAEKTRENWDNAKRPFEVSIEALSTQEMEALSSIGIYTNPKDATEEESVAFQGTAFMKNENGSYQTSDRNAVATDSTAQLYVCFPYRKGFKENDTILLNAPFRENLYGREVQREYGRTVSVKVNMVSAMALLRITCGSNHVQDWLEGLNIGGESIYTKAQYLPYQGRWFGMTADGSIAARQADCLLNNGRSFDYYLIPTETAGTVTILPKINQKSYAVKTTLPPLRAGSLTQINLHKTANGLIVNNSWVDTRHAILGNSNISEFDTVKVGHYLQKGGYISDKRDTSSVAIVIQTDGKRGKAVALEDCEGRFCFGNGSLTSGKVFATIDGKRKEGIVNPTQAQEVGDAEKIIFKPGIPYGTNCALGYTNGAELTTLLIGKSQVKDADDALHADTGLSLSRKVMIDEVQKHPGSYVPSLAEMTALYYQLRFSERDTVWRRFAIPSGEYLTSSESASQSFYMIDMENGIITGTFSKQYVKMQLRLFYLF
jgi:outer membrane biogenesis lipoprotein LolB